MAAATCTSLTLSSTENSRFGFASAKPTLRPVMWNARGSESSKRLGSWGIPDILSAMAREISAGGVVLRQISGVWHVALIEPQKNEPQKESPKPAKTPRKRSRAVLALPKGLMDAGEKPQAAAVREVKEETGIVAEPVAKLSDRKSTRL